MTGNASVDGGAAPDSFASNTERRVAEVFATILELRWVAREDDIFSLGGDSFEAVRVALELERCFQIEFPTELLESARKVREIAVWIDAHDPSAPQQVARES